MTQALITVGGVAGSNLDWTINTLCQLDNTNNGGETTYAWTVVDQPAGTSDVLSSASVKNPTFTPKKEGTYLIQIIVNQGLGDEARNRVVVQVKHLKTRIGVPAVGETTEAGSRGYGSRVQDIHALVNNMRADPGIVVVQLASNRSVNDVVRFTSSATLKSGLPGQEKVPVVDTALATQAYILTEGLGVIVAAVDGGALTTGRLAYVRMFGMQTSVSIASIAAGDTIYASDTGTLARTVGTNTRRLGKALTGSGGVGDIWIDGR